MLHSIYEVRIYRGTDSAAPLMTSITAIHAAVPVPFWQLRQLVQLVACLYILQASAQVLLAAMMKARKQL